ncbi:MAG: protoporphyrinogen oxidase, partial [Actinomycetota bacterium]|nr:protoporphyrinogen oxidase [Actinomycetota bacterium]
MPENVVVVGGGITGLASAWYLRRAGLPVALLEAGDRLGGKIKTLELDGVRVEAGPDTFLARVPFAVDLCRELGLADELVAPATGKAWLWIGDRLRPLPERHVLGVPTAVVPLVRSGVLSPAGAARAALDRVLPRGRYGPDPSVAEVVGRRLGRQVVDRLVDPLVG